MGKGIGASGGNMQQGQQAQQVKPMGTPNPYKQFLNQGQLGQLDRLGQLGQLGQQFGQAGLGQGLQGMPPQALQNLGQLGGMLNGMPQQTMGQAGNIPPELMPYMQESMQRAQQMQQPPGAQQQSMLGSAMSGLSGMPPELIQQLGQLGAPNSTMQQMPQGMGLSYDQYLQQHGMQMPQQQMPPGYQGNGVPPPKPPLQPTQQQMQQLRPQQTQQDAIARKKAEMAAMKQPTTIGNVSPQQQAQRALQQVGKPAPAPIAPTPPAKPTNKAAAYDAKVKAMGIGMGGKSSNMDVGMMSRDAANQAAAAAKRKAVAKGKR